MSTRGDAPILDFGCALMAGLAADGGLYMPQAWPFMKPDEIGAFKGRPYADLAAAIMARFTGGDPGEAELLAMARAAYGRFVHPETAPLVRIGEDLHILELFHGPTLAFKDFAMQALGPLIERELAADGARATIIGATSGDTGAAAVEAFAGRANVDLFIFYPHGRVSDAQRRQMTASGAPNVHLAAVEGTFDDCQAIVKALFADAEFRRRHALSGVNSINWARIMAQIPYYVFAALALDGHFGRAPRFVVPTGNFGDIFAGYAAYRMGLAIERLVIAANENDILSRAFDTGEYRPRGVVATTSPSMDIQVSSNFERLLFEASGRDAARVRGMMGDLRERGGFEIGGEELASMRALFSASRASEAEVSREIGALHAETGYLADPHTAVGLAAARAERERRPGGGPIVVLATAHPAKFPDAVRRAAGVSPPIPERLARALAGRECFTTMRNDAAAAAEFIASRAVRAAPTPMAAGAAS